jgi:hypothetical protein
MENIKVMLLETDPQSTRGLLLLEEHPSTIMLNHSKSIENCTSQD